MNSDKIKNIGLIQISACISETCTYPIDYIKTLVQVNKKGSFTNFFIKSIKNNKLQLYTGLKPALLRHTIYTASRISIYENLRENKYLSKNINSNNFAYKFMIGGFSGGISQLIASPCDLLKVRYITNNKNNIQLSIYNTTRSIIKKNGVLGLWKGCTPNIARAILVNFGELATYDTSKQFIKKTTGLPDSTLVHFCSSICSGFVAALCCTPADVIKSRLMKTNSEYTGIINCISKTVQNEGFFALYKGFCPIWLRLAPWQVIFWTSYEQLRKLQGVKSF
tara:strand:+ start:245 stop:1084 length:840 start_codon:yes stop_codon:yes gene_type:complete